jgi:hypothetical protein
MSQEILDKLELLTQPELAKVFKLINKLAAKHDVEEIEPEQVPQKLVGRRKPDLHNIRQPQDSRATSEPVGKINRQKQNEALPIRRGQAKKKVGEIAARSEPMVIPDGPRPNKFFELTNDVGRKIADTSKKDTEDFDRKVKADYTPRARSVQLEQVDCIECGDTYEVDPGLIVAESAGFVCNDCITSRKR